MKIGDIHPKIVVVLVIELECASGGRPRRRERVRYWHALWRAPVGMEAVLKIPSWEGQKALAFGVGPPVRDNPPLHPSRGGE
jgi:hypothetical protein